MKRQVQTLVSGRNNQQYRSKQRQFQQHYVTTARQNHLCHTEKAIIVAKRYANRLNCQVACTSNLNAARLITSGFLESNNHRLRSRNSIVNLRTFGALSSSVSIYNQNKDIINSPVQGEHFDNRFFIIQASKLIIEKICKMNFKSKKQINKLPPPIEDDLLLMPAHKLSKLIKDGSVTSEKLCELFAKRIEQVNQCTNAMTQDRFKDAIEDAKRIDDLLARFRSGKPESEFTPEELDILNSPFMGVPISIKESIAVKGMHNSCGMWNRRDVIADDDAVVVNNLKRFGMVPVCTTNIPECTLYWADCQNKVYGRTLNPYDPTRITGASSGGEGALLGGGGSIIGIGSDIAGSLRFPAQYCGIFSHKPSPFLVSPEGNFPSITESRMRLFTLGPMTRYASDLRPLLKCMLSDKNNPKQDTYFTYQPDSIATIRKEIIQKLDNPSTDLSQLKIYYFKFNEASELKGKQSVQVQGEFMDAQQEILDHFSSKFNCQVEHMNLDKYLKKMLITWECLMCGGGAIGRETDYNANELKDTFELTNLAIEILKLPFGLSKHTKESLVTLSVGSAMPKDRNKVFELCDQFEKFGSEIKAEFNTILGENGVLIMPTLPSVAYKHNVAIFKKGDLRFTTLFNVLQVPVTHATIRLDKKHKMPYGFSIAAKEYNDPLSIAVAEEIELVFGGWTPPTGVANTIASASKISNDIQTNTNQVESVQQPQTVM